MPNYSHLVQVARQLKHQLNGRAWLTIPRMEITNMVRDASGEDATRIKSGLAAELERALLEQGVRCYPSVQHTSTGDTIRLFHPGTVIANLVDILSHPDPSNDAELAEITRKVKGEWDWERTRTEDVGARQG